MLVVLTAGFAPLVNGMYQENISDEERLILESKDPFIMIGFDDYKPEKRYFLEHRYTGPEDLLELAKQFCAIILYTCTPKLLFLVKTYYGVNKVVFKRCSDMLIGENVYTCTDLGYGDQPFNVRITLHHDYVLVESPEIPASTPSVLCTRIGKNVAENLRQQARALGLKIEDCPNIY